VGATYLVGVLQTRTRVYQRIIHCTIIHGLHAASYELGSIKHT
jgi:hypothetical protein